METATQNNEVEIIENSLPILQSAGEILIANKERKEKALNVGQKILDDINATGMNPQLDERAMKYMANINNACKEMKDKRSSVTQIMDALKKMYTEVENEIDPKKPGTIPAQVQSSRDQFAKQVAEEKERKRKEAELVAAKAKEAVDIRSQAEVRINNNFQNFLLECKQKVQNAFNNITLATWAEKNVNLKMYHPEWKYVAPSLGLFGKYNSKEEVTEIEHQVIENSLEQFKATFQAEMKLLKDDLIDKLPSKLKELQEQKKLEDEAAAFAKLASEAKSKADKEAADKAAEQAEVARKKAEEDRKKREEEEAQKLAAEAEESKRNAERESEIKRQGDQTMVLFEQEAANADDQTAPEARQGYEILVQHPVGYTQIFALWFEHEGKNLPVDKIGNTKLDQMKSWAEKYAHKTGTKIDSKFLKYAETFKAINRKTK